MLEAIGVPESVLSIVSPTAEQRAKAAAGVAAHAQQQFVVSNLQNPTTRQGRRNSIMVEK